MISTPIEDGAFERLWLSHRLLVCLGPGGVGKTTLSAAVALRAAMSGRRVLVLTIDPARRLADALGLSMEEGKTTSVDLSPLLEDAKKNGRPSFFKEGGSLDAAMLRPSAGMDELIDRLAQDSNVRDRILGNQVYRTMSGALTRSHAYLAMEKLYEALESKKYDLVVLDTPPSRSALEILDAPSRLAAFLDEGVVKWFVRDGGDDSQAKNRGGFGLGRLRKRLAQTGGAVATKLLEKIVGEAFTSEVTQFFESFYDLREGFRSRAESVQRAMRRPDAGFAIVTSLDVSPLEDAKALADGLESRGYPLRAVLLNRAYETLALDETAQGSVDQISSSESNEAQNSDRRRELAKLRRYFHSIASDQLNDIEQMGAILQIVEQTIDRCSAYNRRLAHNAEQFLRQLPESIVARKLPIYDESIADLIGLARISEEL